MEIKWNDEMYEPQLWPEGTFVWRFYELRKPRATAVPVDVNTLPATRNVYLPDAGASAAL